MGSLTLCEVVDIVTGDSYDDLGSAKESDIEDPLPLLRSI